MVTDSSLPVHIGTVDVALGSNFMTPASEHKLTNPEEVQEAIRGLKFSKSLEPKGISNRALNHFQLKALSLLLLIFKSVLHTHHFPKSWKQPGE
jgi:hypothetical protein